MVRRSLRSRSLRRVKRKVPGNRTSLQYKKKKPQPAICGKCGDVLKGVPHELPYKMRTMPKTYKRPERPYGGVLCSRCSRLEIISKIRQ